jgi:bifunctional DNA-binding transcriptional regulator/antitoxin component of YhaV-PrlF toxin-antitoxin module
MTKIQDETRVSRGYAASIPASVRKALGIEPGDVLVWRLEGKNLRLSVRKHGLRGFEGFVPYDFGHPTDAVAEHDEVH